MNRFLKKTRFFFILEPALTGDILSYRRAIRVDGTGSFTQENRVRINILPVVPVQPLNRGVRAPDPAYFTIISAARMEFLIRVWVPRTSAGQPYTRPRVNGPCPGEGIPGTLSPVDPSFWQHGNADRGEWTDLLGDISPPGRILTEWSGRTDHDDTQRPDNGKKILPCGAPCRGRHSQCRPFNAAPYAGRRMVQGGGDERELAHDHDRPAPP